MEQPKQYSIADLLDQSQIDQSKQKTQEELLQDVSALKAGIKQHFDGDSLLFVAAMDDA